MVDDIIKGYKDDEVLVKEFESKKKQIMEERERLRTLCDPILTVLDRDDVKEVFFYWDLRAKFY